MIVTCHNCHKTDSMDMELRQRYADFAGGKVYPNGVFGVVTMAIDPVCALPN